MEQVLLNKIIPLCLHTLDPRVRGTFRCLNKKIRDYIDKHYMQSSIVLTPNAALLAEDPNSSRMEAIREQRIRWSAILAAPFHLKPQLIYIRTMPRRSGMTFILGNIFSILRDAGCDVSIQANGTRTTKIIHDTYGPNAHHAYGKGSFVLLDHTQHACIKVWVRAGYHIIIGDIEDGAILEWVNKNATLIV